jgi:hypothetical protein
MKKAQKGIKQEIGSKKSFSSLFKNSISSFLVDAPKDNLDVQLDNQDYLELNDSQLL